MAIVNTGTFKPLDWDNISVPYDQAHTITGINTAGTISYNLPGNLINYTMDYDMYVLEDSGMKQDEMEKMFKTQLAEQLARKMLADGHIVFTKQQSAENSRVYFRAYTWVGNKEFIEQQRKNK